MKKHVVKLTDEQRDMLLKLTASGNAPTRKLTHARILLKADSSEGQPNWSAEAISEALDVSLSTIARVRARFAKEGLDAALNPRVHQHDRARRLDGVQEAHLIALACSEAPAGHTRWTLQLPVFSAKKGGDHW